jgi:hypothetical protein
MILRENKMNEHIWHPLLVCSLLLQGCAGTPAEIRELDERGQVGINQPYLQAASCLSQQMDEAIVYWSPKQHMNHTLHTYPERGYAEIISEQGAGGTYVVSLQPDGQDRSTVTIYVSSHMPAARDVAEDIRRTAMKCNRQPDEQTSGAGQAN